VPGEVVHAVRRPRTRVLAGALVALVLAAAALAWLTWPRHGTRGGAVPARSAIYLGVYAPSGGGAGSRTDAVARFERGLGRRVAIDQHYYDWTDPFPGRLEQDDARAGRIPLLTWQPTGVRLADVADGRDDALLRARAAALRSYGRPVLLRLAHEPNGDWYTWSEAYDRGPRIPGNTAAAYVRAWRHVHAVFAAAGADNVAWVWSPNFRDYPAGNRAERYYPGDDVVDWVGIDAYNGVPGGQWTGVGPLIAPLYQRFARRKPLMLSEVGTSAGGGRRAAWIDGLAAELPARYPAVRAVVWFDRAAWEIDHDTRAFAAFARMARAGAFSARPPS
jgi:hypothetical protein